MENHGIVTVLAVYRRTKGLSQHELARRVGCHQSTLSLIERGYENPRESLLKALAEELDYSKDSRELLQEVKDGGRKDD